MRNHALEPPLPIKHHPIRARLPPPKRRFARQDGKFIVRRRIGEIEALVVLVLMGVPIGGGAGLQVAVALLDGGVDVGLAVAGAAAGVGALLAAVEEEGGGEGGGGGVEGGEEEEGFEGEHGCGLGGWVWWWVWDGWWWWSWEDDG